VAGYVKGRGSQDCCGQEKKQRRFQLSGIAQDMHLLSSVLKLQHINEICYNMTYIDIIADICGI
jgi:hypothetical protein